jgi:hypothetical protein
MDIYICVLTYVCIYNIGEEKRAEVQGEGGGGDYDGNLLCIFIMYSY